MPIVIELKNTPPTRRKEKAAEKKKRKKGIGAILKGSKKQGDPSPTPFDPRNPIAKKKKKKPLGLKGGKGTPVRTEKKGVPHGVNKKDQEGNTIIEVAKGGSVSKFPDLSGDGKVTKKDILMGRGVIKKRKGGKVTGRSIGPAGASIVSDDGKRIKKLKTMAQSLAQSIAGSAFAPAGKLAGRLAKRGYGKAKK